MADKPVRADKATAVAELSESFRASSATVLTEYRGLTVAQLKDLRRSLGRTTTYTITKNTLAKRAAVDAGISGLDTLFTGPTALAFVSGDPVEAAKGLREFAKTHPLLVIKGGVFEGKAISAAEVSRLADLESARRNDAAEEPCRYALVQARYERLDAQPQFLHPKSGRAAPTD